MLIHPPNDPLTHDRRMTHAEGPIKGASQAIKGASQGQSMVEEGRGSAREEASSWRRSMIQAKPPATSRTG